MSPDSKIEIRDSGRASATTQSATENSASDAAIASAHPLRVERTDAGFMRSGSMLCPLRPRFAAQLALTIPAATNDFAAPEGS